MVAALHNPPILHSEHILTIPVSNNLGTGDAAIGGHGRSCSYSPTITVALCSRALLLATCHGTSLDSLISLVVCLLCLWAWRVGEPYMSSRRGGGEARAGVMNNTGRREAEAGLAVIA